MVLVMDAGGAVQNRYLWGAAVDEILADEQVGGELLWTLTDNLGTVRELVNNTSTVRNHIVYDTYGNVLSETAGGARSAIKFTGRYFDTETGLQWNLNRWYDAKTGRWLSQDPIGFEGGDGNLYRYVGNDPGNGVDPSGLAVGHHWVPQSVIKSSIGFLDPDAQRVFAKGTRLPPYVHQYDTWNGVTHDAYNDTVRELLQNYRNVVAPGRRLSGPQATTFLKWIAQGRCTDADFAKENAVLLKTARDWRKGFLQSVIVADEAYKADRRLKPEELKAIARRVVNQDDSIVLSSRARSAMDNLRRLGKVGLMDAAQRLLPLLNALELGEAACRGYSGQGYESCGTAGAFLEVNRELVCAELVEGIVFPQAQSWADWLWEDMLNMKGAEQRVYNRRTGGEFDSSGLPRD